MDQSLETVVIWLGVLLCLSQSAMFSGLNLAFFSLDRLQLEILAADGDSRAARVLAMRRDASWLLTTILWGNVGINVLLTLLVGSVLVGALAFVFSTVVITFGGGIVDDLGGFLAASSCSFHVSEADFEGALNEAAKQSVRAGQIVIVRYGNGDKGLMAAEIYPDLGTQLPSSH